MVRGRKGEETSTLSYLLPKLHEEEMALPADEEPAERKRPEQPALATFVMPDVPPAPEQDVPVAAPAAAKPAVATAAPAQPGLLSRFFGALKNIFSGAEETKPAEPQVEKKAEEKPERQQERRKPRTNNRRDRNDRRDNRDGRDNRDSRAENTEGREPRESREENRRNRREKQQQNV